MTTIMIVEDEPIIREISAEFLEELGYVVIEADSADEALAVLNRRSDISLLFTDIRMPGEIDGLELAKRVHEMWPAIRLLLTSGHKELLEEEIPDHGEFIHKPYRPADLTQRIARLLTLH